MLGVNNVRTCYKHIMNLFWYENTSPPQKKKKKKKKKKLLMLSGLLTDFRNIGSGCLSNDHKLNDIHNLYVEINLSGCKYLCQYLHNKTCTLVMFLPNSRSCVLLPLQHISILDEHASCKKVEIYRKQRIIGNDTIKMNCDKTYFSTNLRFECISIVLCNIPQNYMRPKN